MKHHCVFALTALGAYAGLGRAQLLSYVTAVITECSDLSETEATSTADPAVTHTVTDTCSYSMPVCDCGCETCTFTSVYTTAYPILCPTGVAHLTYTITETFAGMSTLPTFAEPTGVPYGFTVTDAICTICGEEPVTTVITCPSGGATYHTGAQTTASSAEASIISSSTSSAASSSASENSNAAASPGSYAASSAAPIPTEAGANSAADTDSGNYAGEQPEDDTSTSTITKTLAQAEAGPNKPTSVPAGHASNAPSQGSIVPVQVSSASLTRNQLAPVLFVLGLISARMTLC